MSTDQERSPIDSSNAVFHQASRSLLSRPEGEAADRLTVAGSRFFQRPPDCGRPFFMGFLGCWWLSSSWPRHWIVSPGTRVRAPLATLGQEFQVRRFGSGVSVAALRVPSPKAWARCRRGRRPGRGPGLRSDRWRAPAKGHPPRWPAIETSPRCKIRAS